MTYPIQWKGRLTPEDQGYPFENGPPFLTAAGAPIHPNRTPWSSGAVAGITPTVSATSAVTGTLTLLGTSTADTIWTVWVAYQANTTSDPKVRYAGMEVVATTGTTDEQAAAALVAKFNERAAVYTGLTAAASLAVITFTTVGGSVDAIPLFTAPAP